MPDKAASAIPAAVKPISTTADPGLVKTQVTAVPVMKPVNLFVKGRVSGMAGE